MTQLFATRDVPVAQLEENRAVIAVTIEHGLLRAVVETGKMAEDERFTVDLDRVGGVPRGPAAGQFQVATLYCGSRTIPMSSKNAGARSTQR